MELWNFGSHISKSTSLTPVFSLLGGHLFQSKYAFLCKSNGHFTITKEEKDPFVWPFIYKNKFFDLCLRGLAAYIFFSFRKFLNLIGEGVSIFQNSTDFIILVEIHLGIYTLLLKCKFPHSFLWKFIKNFNNFSRVEIFNSIIAMLSQFNQNSTKKLGLT